MKDTRWTSNNGPLYDNFTVVTLAQYLESELGEKAALYEGSIEHKHYGFVKNRIFYPLVKSDEPFRPYYCCKIVKVESCSEEEDYTLMFSIDSLEVRTLLFE